MVRSGPSNMVIDDSSNRIPSPGGTTSSVCGKSSSNTPDPRTKSDIPLAIAPNRIRPNAYQSPKRADNTLNEMDVRMVNEIPILPQNEIRGKELLGALRL